VIASGKQSLEDILGNVKSGYYIKGVQGAHSSNQETGDYSVVGNPAYRIIDGELTGAIHGLMLAGNAFELIKKADVIGNDVRSYLIWGGSLIAPSIQFKDIQVVAKAE
jgi:PmbA protein